MNAYALKNCQESILSVCKGVLDSINGTLILPNSMKQMRDIIQALNNIKPLSRQIGYERAGLISEIDAVCCDIAATVGKQ